MLSRSIAQTLAALATIETVNDAAASPVVHIGHVSPLGIVLLTLLAILFGSLGVTKSDLGK